MRMWAEMEPDSVSFWHKRAAHARLHLGVNVELWSRYLKNRSPCIDRLSSPSNYTPWTKIYFTSQYVFFSHKVTSAVYGNRKLMS